MLRSLERFAVFEKEFSEDLHYWVKVDRKTALRVMDLVEAVMREPFTGIAKPEPLRHSTAGCWSRRITQERRLVYFVLDDRISFLQARFHY